MVVVVVRHRVIAIVEATRQEIIAHYGPRFYLSLSLSVSVLKKKNKRLSNNKKFISRKEIVHASICPSPCTSSCKNQLIDLVVLVRCRSARVAIGGVRWPAPNPHSS